MIERVSEPQRTGEGHVDVAALAPFGVLLVKEERRSRDAPAERCEDPLGGGGPTAAAQHGDAQLQRDRDRRQAGAVPAVAAHGAAEGSVQRRGEQA